MKYLLSRAASARATVAVLAALLLLGLSATVLGSSPPDQISYDWTFATGSNSCAPAVSSTGAPAATAAITTGLFSTGWLASHPTFGSANGIWDLGQNGKITISASSGFTGSGNPASVLSVKVVQWIDGGIFSSHAGVSVPNATIISTNSTTVTEISPPDGIGVWIMEETRWNVSAGALVNSVLVSSALPSSVIDSVSAEFISTAIQAQPPVLTILPIGPGNQVKISWPTNSGPLVLESNADLANQPGWSAVGSPPQLDGNSNYVILNATNAMQFFRLKLQ